MSTAIYSHPDCSLHEMGSWHPEAPGRLRAIEDQMILARLDGLVSLMRERGYLSHGLASGDGDHDDGGLTRSATVGNHA